MRFLADIGVALRVAEWLRAQGHDVVHFGDAALDSLGVKARQAVGAAVPHRSAHGLSPVTGQGILWFRVRRPTSSAAG